MVKFLPKMSLYAAMFQVHKIGRQIFLHVTSMDWIKMTAITTGVPAAPPHSFDSCKSIHNMKCTIEGQEKNIKEAAVG